MHQVGWPEAALGDQPEEHETDPAMGRLSAKRGNYPLCANHQTIAVPTPRNAKAPLSRGFRLNLGGKPGIRTLGTLLTVAGFQDRYANSRGPMP